MTNYSEEIYELLVRELRDVPASNIFRYIVPPGFHETTEAPIIRITPLPGYPGKYADDSQLSEEVNIQIDIWWSEREPRYISRIIQALMSMEHYQQVYQEALFEEETFNFREILRYQGFFINKEEL